MKKQTRKVLFQNRALCGLKAEKTNFWVTPERLRENFTGLAMLVYPSAESGSPDNLKSRNGKHFYFRYREKDPTTGKSKQHNQKIGAFSDIGIDDAKNQFILLKKQYEELKASGELLNDPRKKSKISELLTTSLFTEREIERLNLLFMRMFGDYHAKKVKISAISLARIKDINERMLKKKHKKDIERDNPSTKKGNPRSAEEHRTVALGYGLAPNTVARDMAALKIFLNRAVDFKIIQENPFSTKTANQKIITKTSRDANLRERENLTQEESQRFLEQLVISRENWKQYLQGIKPFREVEEPYARLIALICFEVGSRINEIRHLTYQQFDFDRGIIWRDKKIAKDLSSKTNSTKDDYINVSDIVLAEVKQYWLDGYEGRKIQINRENGHLFWNKQTKKPIGELRKSWNNFLSRAGIERIGFHGLRRTLGSDLYRLTKNSLLVRDQLGHSDVKITETYYIDIEEEEINQALNDLSKSRRNDFN